MEERREGRLIVSKSSLGKRERERRRREKQRQKKGPKTSCMSQRHREISVVAMLFPLSTNTQGKESRVTSSSRQGWIHILITNFVYTPMLWTMESPRGVDLSGSNGIILLLHPSMQTPRPSSSSFSSILIADFSPSSPSMFSLPLFFPSPPLSLGQLSPFPSSSRSPSLFRPLLLPISPPGASSLPLSFPSSFSESLFSFEKRGRRGGKVER